MDDLIAQFIDLTGASDEVARHYLEMCESDVANAVQLFLDHDTPAPIPAPVMQPPPAPVIRSTGFDLDHNEGSDEEEVNTEAVSNMLFKPPPELICHATWDYARNTAKRDGKLLLVCVYDPKEFVCQALNRDLFNNKEVKDFVKENFVFLYLSHSSSEGKRHINYYHLENYPYVGIVDPVTGERMKKWNYLVEPMDFVTECMDALDRFRPQSFEPPTKKQKSADGNAFDLVSSDEDSFSFDEDGEEIPEETKDEFSSIPAVDHPEPSSGDVTRVQIRMNDGSRIVRKVLTSDKVRILYELLKCKVEGKFEIKSFRQEDLWDKRENTIKEANLENGVVNVEIVET